MEIAAASPARRTPPAYRFLRISCRGRPRYSKSPVNEDEQIRYHDLLDQFCAVSDRVTRLEADQRVVVELLQDAHGILRLVAARLRSLDGEIDRMRACLPLAGHGQRIDRHLRN